MGSLCRVRFSDNEVVLTSTPIPTVSDEPSSLKIKPLDVSSGGSNRADSGIPFAVAPSQSVCEHCDDENHLRHVLPSHGDKEQEHINASLQDDDGNAEKRRGIQSMFLSEAESIQDLPLEDNSDLSSEEIERLLLGDENDLKDESNRVKYAYFYSSRSRTPSATTEPTVYVSKEIREEIASEPREYMWTRINNAMCKLDISKVTIRFHSSDKAALSLLSDDQRRARDELVDKELIANERVLRTEEEFQKQWDETIRKEGDIFAHDHLPAFYVQRSTQLLLQRERAVVGALSSRMHSDPCFASVVAKYAEVQKQLSASRAEIIRQVREAVRQRRSARTVRELVKEEPAGVSVGVRMMQRVQAQREYEKKVAVSDAKDAVCDGCFAAKKEPLLARIDYHDGMLLRKLVGDTEVEEVNTAATRACVEMALRVGWLPPENAAPDVTAVLIASGYNRLFALRHFLYRWRG